MNPNERMVSQLRQQLKALGLTDEDLDLQEVAPVLNPQPSSKPDDLEFYEQVLQEMAQRQYPLRESDRRELDYFRGVFHLSDEEVWAIEQRVLTTLGLISEFAEADPFPASPTGSASPYPVTQPNGPQTWQQSDWDDPPGSPLPPTVAPIATNNPDDYTDPQSSVPNNLAVPEPGVTLPPQDTYAGPGSYATTVPNKPLNPNRVGIQNTAIQAILRKEGGLGAGEGALSPETVEQLAMGQVGAGVTPETGDATSQVATPESGAIAAPAHLTQPTAISTETTETPTTEQPNPTDTTQTPPAATDTATETATGGNNSATSTPAQGNTGGNAAVATAKTGNPPTTSLLDKRFLIPFFLLLAAATAVLVIWAMTRLFAMPTSATDPQRSQQYAEWGTQKTQQGQFQAAIKDFDQAIQLNPKDSNAYINRGYALHRSGNLNAALNDYNKAIELNPKSAQAFSNRSHVRFDQGNYQEAEKDANRAISLDKNLPEAHVNLGNALFAQNDLDRAAQEFQTVLQLPASNLTKSRAYNNRGNIFLANKQLPEAGQQYDQAIQLDPQYADAFFNRGIAYERMKNWPAALQDFSQAANLYKAQGRDRRSQEAQAKANQVKQNVESTPMPPATQQSI